MKDGLFVIRGPFVHEPGDVAVRVTPEGLILVDDKYPENLTDVLAALRTVTTQPIRYMLNSHHHGDHVSGNVNVAAMGVDIIAHRNIRENFLRLKQPGAPNIVFEDRGGLYLGGVEVRMHHLGRGHTNGDTVIHFPDLRAIHMGDLGDDAGRGEVSDLEPSPLQQSSFPVTHLRLRLLHPLDILRTSLIPRAVQDRATPVCFSGR